MRNYIVIGNMGFTIEEATINMVNGDTTLTLINTLKIPPKVDIENIGDYYEGDYSSGDYFVTTQYLKNVEVNEQQIE